MLFKELSIFNDRYKYLRVSARPLFDFQIYTTAVRVYSDTGTVIPEADNIYYSPQLIKEGNPLSHNSFDVPLSRGALRVIISIVAKLDNPGPDEIITTLIED